MDRITTAMIGGEMRPLNYSIEVMFNVAERFGNIQKALEILEKDSLEAFDAVKWFAIQMANDAELCRREEGYDPWPMLSDKDLTARIKPLEFEELRAAVVEAIQLGYQRDIEEPDKETDLGLAELQAKKAPAGE